MLVFLVFDHSDGSEFDVKQRMSSLWRHTAV